MLFTSKEELATSQAVQGWNNGWGSIVSIRYFDGRYCGGSLVSDLFVLTAAHCVDKGRKPSEYHVRLGEYDLHNPRPWVVIRSVDSIMIQEHWTGNVARGNDIALLKLSESVEFSKFIQPIELPPTNFNIDDKKAWVAGRSPTNNK